ncbi:cilia- and flagella-associated protein 206 isoform X2 [Chanos chanos]|uniref:Cilia- and flagella-associated protein 206 n=1 Tax=Chanos chanos TaxID=29144 RepID=A0A6J2VZJ8_CHACN|nr:cilia- and flagella-associated protein 206 isoform X2 [Chanos chanos]
MSRAQAESVIKNIIREIAQECSSKGEKISETVVAFMVKAVVLDPKNHFNVDRTLTKQDVQKLIELCVNRLLDHRSPALDTIKMQVDFDMQYMSRREFLDELCKVLQSRVAQISREITDSRARARDELEGLYHKIVSYVVQHSGLGSLTDINIVREVTAGVQSVFPQSELGTFMSLTKKDKERQLSELSMIVTGICLFNKDCGKGGESIQNLPGYLNEVIPDATRDLELELEACQAKAWKYTALVERLTETGFSSCKVPPDLLRQALYNLRQHEAFLKITLADVILCAKQVETLQTEFIEQLKLLKDKVHGKKAVPTAQVFPLFIDLAKQWSGMRDESALLSFLSDVVVRLRLHLSAQSQLLSETQLNTLLEGVHVKTDMERVSESSEDKIDPSEMMSCEWFLPETTANFDTLPLQYRGVCGYTLVEKDGLLLPANTAIGILKHRERYYGFVSKEAAYKFASKPDEYISLIADRAKSCPELIQLLELYQQFARVTPYSEMQSGEKLLVKPLTKSDSSTQTDTHPVDMNIVKSYEWNEWELRRKALKLVSLRTKVTHSVQTDLSHFRRHNCTQTYLPKDAVCQTKRDGTSSVPKPQIYLAGLRGEKTMATNMIKVNLTRSVDE